jgi:hypothetical protein
VRGYGLAGIAQTPGSALLDDLIPAIGRRLRASAPGDGHRWIGPHRRQAAGAGRWSIERERSPREEPAEHHGQFGDGQA